MYIGIICLVLFLVVSFFTVRREEGWKDKLKQAFSCLCGLLFLAGMIVVLAPMLWNQGIAPRDWVLERDDSKTLELVALSDSPSKETGSRFLIPGDDYYNLCYATETEDGLRIREISKDKLFVLRRENETPHMEVYYGKDFKNGSYYWLTVPIGKTFYVFVIPDGNYEDAVGFDSV